MLRDITLGQYYPSDSVIHKMDPRVKLFGTLVFIISLFLFQKISVYVVATLFLACVIGISKVPFSFMVKGLKGIFVLMMITVVFNLFLTPGTTAFAIWKLKVTWEGIRQAAFMAVRLTYLILGSSVLTLTTTPNNLTDGLEKALSPLKKIKVPVHDLAMMMTIALRFIPTLIEETDKIISAQKARGVDFEGEKMMDKVKSAIPIIIPLFVSAVRRAGELATAMECRCYQSGVKRTKMRQLKSGFSDYAALTITILYFAGVIFINVID